MRTDSRYKYELKLKSIFGIEHFYDEQWDAIQRILNGERILMIQRTGFGKSLCYQFPATQFDGLTVVFSPLIALMRDQVNGLKRKGISAAFINSEQTEDENKSVINQAISGELKILYIAPERQENTEWITASQHLNLSMVVIDEAHTISTWGHDFRPAFRRIINLVRQLPDNLPILATTATATHRVQSDIEMQIGGKLTTIRGSLVRNNFHLFVMTVKSEDEKLQWIAQNLPNIPGTGFIYTGTRVDAELYANWLRFCGYSAVEYHAGLDRNTRMDIENGLMNDKWKCIVSTNALGMGIDKPDIRFVIHTQIPQSPIHYYQEIGRAGRDGKPTTIILFYNSTIKDDGLAEDYRLPKAFIEGARPSVEIYERVIEKLKLQPLSEREIIKIANLKQNQVRIIKLDLIEQGIIREVLYGKSKKYEYQYNAPALNFAKFQELRELKIKELDAMVGYVSTAMPRMQYLCGFLDSSEQYFFNCDNTNLPKLVLQLSKVFETKLNEFRETSFPLLEVESARTNLKNGYASSYYGVSSVGSALHRCKYENGGDFPDFLLRLTLKAFYRHFKTSDIDLVLFVPPTHSGKLVENFAIKFAKAINKPISKNLIKTRETKEQKIFQNGYNKRDNVSGAFDIIDTEIIGKRIILLDDIYDSGATIKEIGQMLSTKGALSIIPIVIAKTVGGTI
ncbi:MAG: RecQ family ATP-dependent DNA helicase [Bacteroides sp.]|nr:RecQ family ATP-dependent DNA helicase [Bacteroides sp.]